AYPIPYQMLPPPSNQFSNHNELLEYVRAFSKTQEYAVTIKRSQADKNSEIKNMTLGCDRSGSYRNRLNLTNNSCCRQTALRLLSCPFELYGQWEQVQRMSAAGSHPCQILATIHQNDSSSMAISRTIYNTLYSICQERLNGHMPVQALIDELQGSDFEFKY
ncbi:2823_t:CDS:2, partial [Cetraspora pellucida]